MMPYADNPVKELQASERIELNPGECTTVAVTILAPVDSNPESGVEPDEVGIMVGGLSMKSGLLKRSFILSIAYTSECRHPQHHKPVRHITTRCDGPDNIPPLKGTAIVLMIIRVSNGVVTIFPATAKILAGSSDFLAVTTS